MLKKKEEKVADLAHRGLLRIEIPLRTPKSKLQPL